MKSCPVFVSRHVTPDSALSHCINPDRHRLAIIEWLAAAESALACADERRALCARQRNALAVIELQSAGRAESMM
jgi:hypothetical protein